MNTETSDDLRTSQTIVRMYSSTVESRITEESSAYPLSQVLVAGRGRDQDIDPWRRFFERHDNADAESDPIADILRTESSKLREKWTVFYHGCSNDDRLDLDSSKPTIEGVLEVIKRIEHDWKSQRQDTRRGKITSLSAALSTITDHVAECQVKLELYETREMKEAVVRLYADIFLLLSDLMDHLAKTRLRRLLDSFNEDLYKRYEQQISGITSQATKIQSLAGHGTMAEVRAIKLQLNNMEHNMIAGLGGEDRLRAEFNAANDRRDAELLEAIRQRDPLVERQCLDYLAGKVVRMLEDKALEAVKDRRAAARFVNSAASFPLAYITGPGAVAQIAAPVPTPAPYVADDLLLQSAQFETFFERERVRLSGMQLRPITQTYYVIRRLSNWVKADPSILWLEGPASPLRDEYNPLTTIAASVVELADQAKVHVISYFCHLPRGECLRPGNTTPEAQASVALITSLTRQTMELLLPQFETKLNLSEVRLSLVKGTMESLPETLRLFGDLLETLDMQLLCVIDGLHWLDDRGTTTILVDLVKMLRNSSAKVLFTTTGRSACLQSEIEWANSRVEGQFAMR
ncbi:hypothetical protein PG990_013054 [Apiospora arundinis]